MTKKDNDASGTNPFHTLFSSVNLNVDKAQVIQNAFVLLTAAQKQAGQLKRGVQSEVEKLKASFENAYGDIGTVVLSQSKVVKDQAKLGVEHLVEQWESNKSKLPPIVTNEVDGLLRKVGVAGKSQKGAVKTEAASKGNAKTQQAKTQPVKKISRAKPTAKSNSKADSLPKPKPVTRSRKATKAKKPVKKKLV